MTEAKRSVAFCTLGCKVNQYETDAMEEQFAAAGYAVLDFTAEADVYVINTCTVTNIADRKSRQMLHRAKKRNPHALVAAVGCYVQNAAGRVLEDPAVDLVIGNDLKKDIVGIVEKYLTDRDQQERCFVRDLTGGDEEFEDMPVTRPLEHTRAVIKIQDGCNQFCSYCAIPYARGRVRSRSMESVLKEAALLSGSGCHEVVLTGIHISSYGTDFGDDDARAANGGADGTFQDSRLGDLILALGQLPGVERIRLGSIEPRIITEDFTAKLASVPQLCPHFHLSLQSGCGETLRRMNRHYTPDQFLESCRILRRYFDRPAITTDIIVGFPGETDEEFAQSRRFVREAAFADMHVFKYSRRDGTRAALMKEQVSPAVMDIRSAALIADAERMHEEYIRQCRDMTMQVLLEEPVWLNGQQYMTGYSKNYIRCAFLLPPEMENQVVSGKAEAILTKEFVLCRETD